MSAFRGAALYAALTAACILAANWLFELTLGGALSYALADLIKSTVFAAITVYLILFGVHRQMLYRYRAEAAQRQAELDLLAAHDELEERVQVRTMELAKANNILQAEICERQRAEKELSALLQISRDVASTFELKPLLDLILDKLADMVGYTGAGVFGLDGDTLTTLSYRGSPPQTTAQFHSELAQTAGHIEVMQRRLPVITAEFYSYTSSTPLGEERLHAGRGEPGAWGSWMGVPLIVKDRVIAVMHLAHTQPNYFTPHHAELALALANQAAVAVENARLYKEAQRAAALDERQRLARDLHDSLSQALFGIALSANAAQETWVQGRDIGSSLDVILRLADSALENVRALILELRPEVLEREGLTAALTKQVQETCARHQLQATCELGEEPDLPLEAKEALYWIAQEALNNVIRHAKAKHVVVRLHQTADAVVLEVYDDGVGFSPSTPVPGHLGRQSMQERAARLGGTLDITSRPGEGTCVQATIGLKPVESPQHLRK